jgi:Ca2+-binding RTX toxin-like protein
MGERSSRVRVLARAGMVLLLTGVVVVGSAGTAGAVTHAESGDAGDLLPTAQEPVGVGALTAITGTVSFREDVDLYKICVDSNAAFSATTVGTAGTLGDTQLWLFNANGQGVEMDDNVVGEETDRSTLPLGGNPGPTTGVYYLGISAFDTDALTAPSPEGFLIFPDVLVGVQGSISNERTLGGWNDNLDNPLSPSTYTIALTGVHPCTAPPPAAACPASPAATITGTNGADSLVGTAGDDVILGLGGDDRILGMGGNDTILGGAGIDRLVGGDGNDILCGGTEVDYLTGSGGNDSVEGQEGDDQLDGGPGTNTAVGGPGTDICANAATLIECSP